MHILEGLTATCESLAEALAAQELEDDDLQPLFQQGALNRLESIAKGCGCAQLVLKIAESLPAHPACVAMQTR